jgi:hypothetical protein
MLSAVVTLYCWMMMVSVDDKTIVHAFITPSASTSSLVLSSSPYPPMMASSSWSSSTYCYYYRHRLDTRRYNFFQDAFNKAFENDRNLAADKRKGQYDAPGEEFDDPSANVGTLTETQIAFRQKMRMGEGSTVGSAPSSSSSGKGGNVISQMLTGTVWTLDLFLSGVPERDPSNDLYGSKVNISSRDKETGLALPSAPSTTLRIELQDGGVCRASSSSFTSGTTDGEWKLSDDGKVLRFSIDTIGYTRRVDTKGSIQKIYWTDEAEKSVQTSTTYSIPPGFVYGDIPVIAGRRVGTLNVGDSGVLRLEKSSGLFGIASKMVACGKFVATRNLN